ncbi:MAG: HutD/Ves family protein [Caldimonas sp.]
MQPLLVRTADVDALPWKNGGGVTRELLARPDAGDWRVRVSVAEVASDGPFSAFRGVERRFAVLDGAGVVLTIDGRAHRVTRDDEALAFSGSSETHCRLLDGPTRDLNLMLRGVPGGLCRVVPDERWRVDARECGLYATTAGTCFAMPAASERCAVPAQVLCWWSEAPAAIVFDGAGWWLRAGTAANAVGTTS